MRRHRHAAYGARPEPPRCLPATGLDLAPLPLAYLQDSLSLLLLLLFVLGGLSFTRTSALIVSCHGVSWKHAQGEV